MGSQTLQVQQKTSDIYWDSPWSARGSSPQPRCGPWRSGGQRCCSAPAVWLHWPSGPAHTHTATVTLCIILSKYICTHTHTHLLTLHIVYFRKHSNSHTFEMHCKYFLTDFFFPSAFFARACMSAYVRLLLLLFWNHYSQMITLHGKHFVLKEWSLLVCNSYSDNLLALVSFGSFSLRELTCMHCVYLVLWTRKVLCGSCLCAIYKIFIHSFISFSLIPTPSFLSLNLLFRVLWI